MPNLAIVLKEEIRRLAKREIKAQTGKTKQAVARYRGEIAQLKRQLQEQQKKVAFLEAQQLKHSQQAPSVEEPLNGVRFSARSARAQRKRLGLSAADYGKLVGVSSLTIYHWEHGKARPRKAQLAALIGMRNIGKREAAARLELLKAAKKPAGVAASRKGKKRRS